MLQHWNGGLNWCEINPSEQQPFSIPCAPSIELTAIPLLSNAPPYSPRRDNPHPGDNIGLFIRDRVRNQSLRSEEHTSELQSRPHLVCRLLLEKKKLQQS